MKPHGDIYHLLCCKIWSIIIIIIIIIIIVFIILHNLTLLPCWCCCSELVSSTHKHFGLPLQRKWSEGLRGGEVILITRPLLLLWILPGEDWFEHPAQSGMLTPFKCPCPLSYIYSYMCVLTANGQCQYERKKTGAKHQHIFSSFLFTFSKPSVLLYWCFIRSDVDKNWMQSREFLQTTFIWDSVLRKQTFGAS